MTARAAWFLSCLLFAGAAHAGSAPAELSCVSESGKVALKGVIPSPSSEELNIKLSYFDASLTFTSDTASINYLVSDFPQSVFTLLVPSGDTALTLYALPSSVAVEKNATGDIVGTFQAKLTAPRPRSTAGAQNDSPLKATLKCDYRYSL
ncbi:hypothetical protein CQ050_21075 [Achromobacter sp. MYb9]|uniref:hypothetical protein n=1 Tax=Achromobacter sp. MYb9 TaxID=1827284 RepID=UPI000CFD41ED|nr:hypothetical protein [Achromobacter sp. MYb9]PQZ64324.1 hypothetical protein CQ050_21075 [Achromobacter sp. MYb9]